MDKFTHDLGGFLKAIWAFILQIAAYAANNWLIVAVVVALIVGIVAATKLIGRSSTRADTHRNKSGSQRCQHFECGMQFTNRRSRLGFAACQVGKACCGHCNARHEREMIDRRLKSGGEPITCSTYRNHLPMVPFDKHGLLMLRCPTPGCGFVGIPGSTMDILESRGV